MRELSERHDRAVNLTAAVCHDSTAWFSIASDIIRNLPSRIKSFHGTTKPSHWFLVLVIDFPAPPWTRVIVVVNVTNETNWSNRVV
jgi:hypothetical protein